MEYSYRPRNPVVMVQGSKIVLLDGDKLSSQGVNTSRGSRLDAEVPDLFEAISASPADFVRSLRERGGIPDVVEPMAFTPKFLAVGASGKLVSSRVPTNFKVEDFAVESTEILDDLSELQQKFVFSWADNLMATSKGHVFHVPTLYHLYDRRPRFKHMGGIFREIEQYEDPVKYDVKYPKLRAILGKAGIRHDDVVLDPFAGTGGFCIAAGHLTPSRVLGVDNAYWYGARLEYAPEENIRAWLEQFDMLPRELQPKFTRPEFMLGDARGLECVEDGSVTKIISSPSYGFGTKRVFGITQEEGFKIFTDSLAAARRVLVDGGAAFYIIPSVWWNERDEIKHRSRELGFDASVLVEGVEGVKTSLVQFVRR